jgi:Flp pilus assembly protein TadD, contains TPR repeats
MSMLSALVIYGILPIIAFLAYSLLDDFTFGLLQGIRDDQYSNYIPSSRPKSPVPNHVQEVQSNDAGQKKKKSRHQYEAHEIKHTEERKGSINYKNNNYSDIDGYISQLREEFRNDPADIYKCLRLAEALLDRVITVHDGGKLQNEAIHTFLEAIDLIKAKKDSMIQNGQNILETSNGEFLKIDQEMELDHEDRSIHGLLVLTYINLGRQYYMANMFEKAVEAYRTSLQLEPKFKDALHFRASSFIILGKYDEAGSDYLTLLSMEGDNIQPEVALGMSKVLSAKESVIPNGWNILEKSLSHAIPIYTNRLSQFSQLDKSTQVGVLKDLKQLHLAMFAYHDKKSGNTELAWYNLSKACQYKMAGLPAYNFSLERQKLDTVRQIFRRGFWPSGVGSNLSSPIFIVGFPRSGSTLLERILDAHPDIVGTGEDSIFNGMLGEIRDGIVQASLSGSVENVRSVVDRFAGKVVKDTKDRWLELERNSHREEGLSQPKRFVDKMLSNYLNVGFIHMLFPKALILHISREPMDALFSCFKHDFPPGNLDYTSDFESLAQIYRNYRDIMDHWDEQLPGRVVHIRYEDIVRDMTGISKSLISLAGLDWDDSILSFHTTKYVTNTHSATQVKRPIYSDSIQSWRRYESHLEPLKMMLGESYTRHKFLTNIPGYSAHQVGA